MELDSHINAENDDVIPRKPPAGVGKLLRSLGLSPKKALGQTFLISESVVRKIITTAGVKNGDLVLEVGPGLGVLTGELVDAGAKVIALEIDPSLTNVLSSVYNTATNVNILNEDARKIDLSELIPSNVPYTMVSNLPYYAGTNILRNFLESDRQPQRIVIMVQREVARRMVALPGRLGLLGIGVQVFGKPEIIAHVPPGAFYPKPKVTSTIVLIEVYREPLIPKDNQVGFFNLVRAGFSAPRKQLGGVLRRALKTPVEDLQHLLVKGSVDPRRRAESLSVSEWIALYELFKGSNWVR